MSVLSVGAYVQRNASRVVRESLKAQILHYEHSLKFSRGKGKGRVLAEGEGGPDYYRSDFI